MLSRYDPSLSSRDYLELLRQMPWEMPFPRHFLNDDNFFDAAVHEEYLGFLYDPMNWADGLQAEGRVPRVFIDAWINQSRNLEVRWGSGRKGIFFAEDFHPTPALMATTRAGGSIRPLGELMWVKGLGHLIGNARNPSPNTDPDRALLFGYKARLDELIRDLKGRSMWWERWLSISSMLEAFWAK